MKSIREVHGLDYSKIDDKIMENIIQGLFMFKKAFPKRTVYFNEKNIMMMMNMRDSIDAKLKK